jgi:hypothetical protein
MFPHAKGIARYSVLQKCPVIPSYKRVPLFRLTKESRYSVLQKSPLGYLIIVS